MATLYYTPFQVAFIYVYGDKFIQLIAALHVKYSEYIFTHVFILSVLLNLLQQEILDRR